MPTQTFLIDTVINGDRQGLSDNNPNLVSDAYASGAFGAIFTDLTTYNRFKIGDDIVKGSTITEAMMSFTVASNYVTDRVTNDGNRRTGFMAYDGKWEDASGDVFGIVNYPLHNDLPRPTEDSSDVIIPGRLYNDMFHVRELYVTEAEFIEDFSPIFGEGSLVTNGDIDDDDVLIVDQLQAFMDDARFNGYVGIAIDGLTPEVTDWLSMHSSNFSHVLAFTLTVTWTLPPAKDIGNVQATSRILESVSSNGGSLI